MCPVKYPRELGKPMPAKLAAKLAAAEPASGTRIDYLRGVLFLLLDHYKIPHDPDQFSDLAVALALDHVPALRSSARGRPLKPKLVKANWGGLGFAKVDRQGPIPAWAKTLMEKDPNLPSDFHRVTRGDKMDLVWRVDLIKAEEGVKSDRQALELYLEGLRRHYGVSKLRMTRSLKTFQNYLSEGRRLLKNASQ